MTTGRINQITIFMSYQHANTNKTHTHKVCMHIHVYGQYHMRCVCEVLTLSRLKDREQDTTHAVLFSDGKPKVLMVFQCAPRALSLCVVSYKRT